jgi:signal transduction histidine kinase/DNA-binding response OmpR family regulator
MTTPPCRVLLVEDSRADAVLLQGLLYGGSENFELTWADSLQQALAQLGMEAFEAILLDLTLPDSQGLPTLETIQKVAPIVPVVVITGLEDERLAIRAIRQGAQDYLVKGTLDGRAIARSIRYAIDRKAAEEALRASEQRFKLLSEISGRLLEAEDPQTVVNDLCTHVMHHLDCHAFFNFLAEEGAGRLRLNAWAGIPEEEARKIERLDYGVAVCGCVARDGVRIIAQDILNTPDPRTELVKSCGIQAYCCHPLMARGRVIGTLSFGTRTRSRFSDEEVSLMKTVADQVAIAMDRLLTRQALRQASEAKDQFLAVLSHELRTPLTPALAAAGVLLEDPGLGDPVREGLEMIRRNINLEVRLIDDLLDVTSIARGKIRLDKSPLDAASILRGAVDICRAELAAKGQTLTIDTPGAPYPVLGDSARLHQVFWNVIKNAIKFTPHGGRIELACSMRAGNPPILVAEIRDTGAGIDPQDLDRIFDPFEQGNTEPVRPFGGLGLGLSISRRVVELHGGRISAFSEGRDRGATLTVELPLADSKGAGAEAPSPRAAEVGRQATGRPLRILLVEDHADTAVLMAREIRRKGGHEVMTEASVEDALAAASVHRFDLLVCDVGLPDGTGLDLMRELIVRGRRIPAIALSGYCLPEDEQKSLAAGFLEHLTKPITIDRLLEAFQRLVPADPSAAVNRFRKTSTSGEGC